VNDLPDDAAETVISAEQRWLGDSMSVGPGSTLCGRLFPEIDPVTGAESSAVVSPTGIELDHFIIDERIGIGGMGAVFRARDTRLGRAVALKVLNPIQSRDPGAVQRFQNEARAAAQLDHDNIARVFFIGEDRELHFIAFEFITGTNVRDLIANRGSLNPDDAVNYTLQIASALVHTMAVGVVHRDIKPSNIIITPTGRAKLVDLGLARNVGPTETSGDLTSDGTTLGTFDYISPEQARDPRNVDVRSDIYSLGCTLYHMLTGEPPYPEGNAFQKLLDHQGKQPPDPSQKNPRVSENLSIIVRRMMASDPGKRFATPEALIRELMFVAEEQGLKGVSSEGMVWMSAGALSASPLDRHLGWMATVAVLLVVVLILRFQPVDRSQSPATGDRLAFSDDGGLPVGSSDPAQLPLLAEQVAGRKVTSADAGNTAATGAVGTGSDGQTSGLPAVATAGPSEKTAPEPSGPAPVAKTSSAADEPDGSPPPPKPRVTEDPRTTPGVKPAAVVSSPVIVISVDGGRPRAYPTLNAALVEAVDGSQIVLQYNGVRVENPVRVTRKNITIRGAEDFRPGIEFRPIAGGDGVQPRMLTVTGGPLQVINTELRMVVPRMASEPLALFSLQRPEQIRLRDVVVTIVNPGVRPAAVIELTPAPGQMRNMKKMMKEEMPAEPLELTMDHSFIRGHADLIYVRQTDSAEVSLNHCVLALGGSLLHAVGASGTAPTKRGLVELKLVHITSLLGENLVRMDSGETRHLPGVMVRSRDSIYSHATNRPLVAMSGDTDVELFRRLFNWRNLEKNFFDDYRVFWWQGSDQSAVGFSAWQQLWEPAGSRNEMLSWQTPRTLGDALTFDRLGLSDFRLDDAIPENRPVATDGSDAGADLERLPPVIGSPRD